MYGNIAFAEGMVIMGDDHIVGFYPGGMSPGTKHEVEISAGGYVYVPLDDPASRFSFDGSAFAALPGYENHPMTNFSWFGAWGFCGYNSSWLPTELEWEKTARDAVDNMEFPWGEERSRNNANFLYGLTDLGEEQCHANLLRSGCRVSLCQERGIGHESLSISA